jgi:hypothetical protein
MDAEKLRTFVNEIGGLKARYPGVGVNVADADGARTTQDDMLYTLKKNVVSFAEECTKSAPKKTKVQELGAQVEGGLRGLNAVGVISDPELGRLSDLLQDLKS